MSHAFLDSLRSIYDHDIVHRVIVELIMIKLYTDNYYYGASGIGSPSYFSLFLVASQSILCMHKCLEHAILHEVWPTQ